MATVLEQAMTLSVDEKLRLIDALWESMAQNPETFRCRIANRELEAAHRINSVQIPNPAKPGTRQTRDHRWQQVMGPSCCVGEARRKEWLQMVRGTGTGLGEVFLGTR